MVQINIKKMPTIETNTETNTEQEETIEKKKYPRKITEPFLKDNRLIPRTIAKIKKKPLPLKKEFKEPLLEILREDGYSETLEGVKSGEFIIKTPKGEKSVMLTPEKLYAWNYGGQWYKKWYADENSMTTLPEDPLHSSEMFRKTTQKLAMNWRDRDEAKIISAKTKMWLFILLGIGILIILIVSSEGARTMVMNIFQGKQVTQQAAALTAAKINLTK